MKTESFFIRLIAAILAVAALTSCSDDEPKDKVKEIRMQISSETGIMYDIFDDQREYPIECMLAMSEDFPGEWQRLSFDEIEGFTYERGHEYYIAVKRTILANPPADASDRTYSLVRILEDRLVEDPEVPVDKEITSEADIEYQDLCPIEKYAVCANFIVDQDGKIDGKTSYDNVSVLPPYDKARIWLENILDKGNPDWRKFQTVPYQATYSYVLTPFTDKIRLVRNESHGPMFKNVVTEDEFARITGSMNSGEEVNYALILANVYKKGLQKIEFTVTKR